MWIAQWQYAPDASLILVEETREKAVEVMLSHAGSRAESARSDMDVCEVAFGTVVDTAEEWDNSFATQMRALSHETA